MKKLLITVALGTMLLSGSVAAQSFEYCVIRHQFYFWIEMQKHAGRSKQSVINEILSSRSASPSMKADGIDAVRKFWRMDSQDISYYIEMRSRECLGF